MWGVNLEVGCFCFCGDFDVIAVHCFFLSTCGFNCYLFFQLKFNATIIIVIYHPSSNEHSLATGRTRES